MNASDHDDRQRGRDEDGSYTVVGSNRYYDALGGVPDDGEGPIPNEAIGLGDALDVDAMRTNPERRPYEVDVHLTLGAEAMDRFVARLTGQDDDVLLAIEHVIQDTLALGRFLPDDDPRGVDVTGAEHDSEILG